MDISEKIESLRKQKGISLTHLNKAIDAYRGKITDVKSGKTSFTEKEIYVLAHELSTSTDYLLGNTDDPSPAGQKRKAPVQGGEPVGPNKRELLDLVDTMSEDEVGALLDLVKATLKMRDKK